MTQRGNGASSGELMHEMYGYPSIPVHPPSAEQERRQKHQGADDDELQQEEGDTGGGEQDPNEKRPRMA